MTPNTLRAYVVCLSFEPPGPVHAGTWLAPDAASAAALATVHFMRNHAPPENLMACLVVEMPAEQLRHYLRAVEGRLPDSGNAEVLSLVPKPGADQESEEEAFARTILSGSAPDYANQRAEAMGALDFRWVGGRFEQTPSRNPLDPPEPPGAA